MKVNGAADYSVWGAGAWGNRICAAALFPGGAVGNMLFFMISGYFLFEKQKSSCKKVVFETSFYSIILALVYLILKYCCTIDIDNYGGVNTVMKFMCLPVASSQNWFSTAYVLIVLLMPQINAFERRLSKRGFLIFLLFVDVFWIGIGSVLRVAFYDLFVALFYYSCGGFYKKYLECKKETKWYDGLCIILAWFLASFISYLYFKSQLSGSSSAMVFNLVLKNVISPICAFFIFRLFMSLKLQSEIVNRIAGTTFIYVIKASK